MPTATARRSSPATATPRAPSPTTSRSAWWASTCRSRCRWPITPSAAGRPRSSATTASTAWKVCASTPSSRPSPRAGRRASAPAPSLRSRRGIRDTSLFHPPLPRQGERLGEGVCARPSKKTAHLGRLIPNDRLGTFQAFTGFTVRLASLPAILAERIPANSSDQERPRQVLLATLTMSSIRQRLYGLSTLQHFRQKETRRHSALYPTYDIPQVWLQHGLKFSGLHPHPSSQIDDDRGAKGAAHAKPATRLDVLEQEREEITRSQDGTHDREQIVPDGACDLLCQSRFRHVGYRQRP